MPTYQYACTACGHHLEAVQSFADEPLIECPSCEGKLRKLFNSVGIVFKGSGFYRTDSRTNGSSGSSSTSESKPDASNGSSGSTSDSAAKPKPAASAPAASSSSAS